MKTEVKITRVDKFVSKKGNPCAFVWYSEDNSFSARLLIFTPEQVNNLPSVGSKAVLYSDMDSNLFGALKLIW